MLKGEYKIKRSITLDNGDEYVGYVFTDQYSYGITLDIDKATIYTKHPKDIFRGSKTLHGYISKKNPLVKTEKYSFIAP